MPPVDNSIMDIINQLEIKSGLEIHGLLVGKNSSLPLNYLCTNWDGQNRVYDFLCKFDPLTILREYQANNNNNNMKSVSSMSLFSIFAISSPFVSLWPGFAMIFNVPFAFALKIACCSDLMTPIKSRLLTIDSF
jgi:hypothetical protein